MDLWGALTLRLVALERGIQGIGYVVLYAITRWVDGYTLV